MNIFLKVVGVTVAQIENIDIHFMSNGIYLSEMKSGFVPKNSREANLFSKESFIKGKIIWKFGIKKSLLDITCTSSPQRRREEGKRRQERKARNDVKKCS
jgi:hypothetical protein